MNLILTDSFSDAEKEACKSSCLSIFGENNFYIILVEFKEKNFFSLCEEKIDNKILVRFKNIFSQGNEIIKNNKDNNIYIISFQKYLRKKGEKYSYSFCVAVCKQGNEIIKKTGENIIIDPSCNKKLGKFKKKESLINPKDIFIEGSNKSIANFFCEEPSQEVEWLTHPLIKGLREAIKK